MANSIYQGKLIRQSTRKKVKNMRKKYLFTLCYLGGYTP